MPKLVDLTAMPYRLDDSQIAWVEETIAGMTDEQKVGQLFTNLFFFGEDTFSRKTRTRPSRSSRSSTSAGAATRAATRDRCRHCSTAAGGVRDPAC